MTDEADQADVADQPEPARPAPAQPAPAQPAPAQPAAPEPEPEPAPARPALEQPGLTQAEPLTHWEVLGWVSVLSGPLAYAVSRLVAETFYGHFQVLPSEVGLGYGTMVTPALVVMVGTAVVGGLVIIVGRAVVAFGVLALAGMIVKLYDLNLRGILLLVGSLLILGLLGAIGSLTAQFGRPFWITALCLLVLVVGALAVRTAQREADQVARGKPVTPSLLGLPLTTIRAARVRLSGLDTPAGLPRNGCVMMLGSSGGVAVIVDGARVWRVPSDYAMTVSDC
jgi:hypothetical protein